MEFKTIVSDEFKIIPYEKQKLLKSVGYGLLAVLCMGLSAYLEQFGLPDELKFLAPMVPVLLNFITKFINENTYVVKK